MLRGLGHSIGVMTLLATVSAAAAQTPPAKDPQSNLYLVATPGQTTLVNKFPTLTACKAAATNWSYNQLSGNQQSTSLWVAAVCLPIE